MNNKYIVYVLRSEKDGKTYTGYTEYLDIRLREHSQGLVKSTKNRRPLKLVYSEEFDSKTEALKREKFFKSGQGRVFLKTVL